MTLKNRSSSSLSSSVSVVTIVVVLTVAIVVSILFGTPHRDLEWEQTIVPLARKYRYYKSQHYQNEQQQSGISATSNGEVYDDSNNNSINSRNDDYPLIGTTIVITGATSGIGYALTNALIRLGGTVIALGRSSSKLQRLHDHCTAMIHINDRNRNTQQQLLVPVVQQKVYTFVMEMSDLSSVAKAGKQIAAQFDTIDILVNNAGMHALDDMFGTKLGFTVTSSRSDSSSSSSSNVDYDRVFVVNYLSHFLFTELLLPSLLRQTSEHGRRQATIVQTSSSYHWGVDGSDLLFLPALASKTTNYDNNQESITGTTTGGASARMPIAARPGGSVGYYLFRTQRSYANSKLAQIYHARALSRKLQQQQNDDDDDKRILPRIISFCPGWVATNIGGPDDTMGTKILAQIAFPSQYGWGIASALHAILSTTHPGPTAGVNNDYYINSKTFLIAGFIFTRPTSSWFYAWGFRDVIANMFANIALLTQRLVAHVETTISSPESYNETIATSLYDWSYQAIEKYL